MNDCSLCESLDHNKRRCPKREKERKEYRSRSGSNDGVMDASDLSPSIQEKKCIQYNLPQKAKGNIGNINHALFINGLISFASLDHVTNETASKKKDTSKVSLRNQRCYIITMIVDFLSIVLPMTLFCTVLAEWTYSSGAVFILVLLFSVASKRCICLGKFLCFTSSSGYFNNVHVGEYGVHWNFFFTLAGVAVLTSIINVSPKYCGLVGSLVLIDCLHLQILGYQVCLMSGLNSYLLSAISQNKEGIYSISGEMLAILMLSDFIPGGKVSILEQAINQNLLAFFIVANLLTGLVNLSVDTLHNVCVAAAVAAMNSDSHDDSATVT
ncbi:putative membrane protein, partial [Tanacetum coccineum]